MRPDRPDTFQWKGFSWSHPAPDLEGFKHWLENCGAKIEPTTSQYEVLRFRAVNHVGIVYENKRHTNKFVHSAGPLYKRFKNGDVLDLRPDAQAQAIYMTLPFTGYPRKLFMVLTNG